MDVTQRFHKLASKWTKLPFLLRTSAISPLTWFNVGAFPGLKTYSSSLPQMILFIQSRSYSLAQECESRFSFVFPDYTCSVFLRSLLLWGWPFGHVTMHSPFTGSYWSPGPMCGHWGRWCLLLSCSGKSQNNFIMWSWSLEFLLFMVQELDIHPCVIHRHRPASPREPIKVLDMTYLRFHSQASSVGPFFF